MGSRLSLAPGANLQVNDYSIVGEQMKMAGAMLMPADVSVGNLTTTLTRM
ncbi:MAG: hypothetical protein ABUS79_10700 [Pseudomonadota bacterium]